VSEYSNRRISHRRWLTNRVSRIALVVVLVLGALLVVLELVVDGKPTGAARALEVITGETAIVAFMAGVLSTAIGAVAFPSRGYWAPGDNELPVWGWWARRLTRVGIRLFWVGFLVAILTTVLVFTAMSFDLISTSAGNVLARVMISVSQAGFMLMIVSSVVWIVAEHGTRRRRRILERHTDGAL
jgi:hypothetical protein